MAMHTIEDRPKEIDANEIDANGFDARLAIAACVRFAAATVPRHAACAECGGLSWTWLARMLDDGDRRTTFDEWTAWLLDHVRRRHPAPCVDRAASFIRAAPARSWTLGRLARECNESPTRLRRGFIDRFGLSPLAYVQGVRVVAAIGLSTSGGKVEALAHEVGYRSKKDLYTALDRWVGRTPLELSRMTGGERERLARRVEALLDRRGETDVWCGSRNLALSARAGARDGDGGGVARHESSTSPA
jgi:AraC-like DNA-binding protein